MLDSTQTGSNGVTSVASSSDRASSGARSLKVAFNGTVEEVGAQLCSSSGSTFDLYNYALNFDFYSDTFTGWVVAMAWNSTTGEWSSSPMIYTTPGTWKDFHGTFGTTQQGAHFNASHIGIYLSTDGTSVSGTAYVDNISLAITPCTPGATQCSGTTPQTCNSSGVWVNGSVTAGQCGAVCTPGATQCSGTTPQTCSSSGTWVNGTGTCACSGTTVCGNCATWGFETGVAAPWAAMSDPTQTGADGVTSILASSDRASSGARSLKVSFANSSYAEVGTQLCASSGSTYDLYNYTLSFDLYSANYTGWVVAMAWNSTTGEWSSSPMIYTTAGAWNSFQGTFGTTQQGTHFNASHIGIYVAGDGNPISGTVYIDNISLTTTTCTPGATQCSGQIPQTCSSSGTWTSGTACTSQACVNGACTGVCTPGATRCSGQTPQTCSSSGVWVSGATCANQCLNGACTTACMPGATQCSGQTPQTCSSSGTWVNGTTCTSQACVNGACTGVCAPGATQCSGQTPQTCSSSGTWTSGTACSAGAVCSAGSCVCSGTSVCGTCASWDFESGSAVPWAATADPTQTGANGVTSVAASTDRASLGTRSLKVSFGSSGYAEIGTQLCSSSGSTYDLYNYTLNFDFYSPSYTGWVVAMAWNATTGEWSSSPSVYLNPGTWQTFQGTFGTTQQGAHFNASHIGIYIAGDGNPISGTAYIDNMYLSH
jgi:hypothetical protein